jgi:ABC-type glycerol-3-phosphate transport system substrate-binding protein
MASVRFGLDASFARRAAALPDFTEQTGIEVALDLLPAETVLHEARVAFGPEPRWDLLAPDEAIVAEQLRNGALEPLGRRAHEAGLDLDDFPQAAIDRFRAGDMVYAIPAYAMSNVLIYRADLLERHGIAVPATWDELRDAAAAAQAALRADGVEEGVGFAAPGLAGYGHNFWVIGSSLFPAWGWQWNRGAGQPPLVYAPETVDALAYYAALLREAGPANAAELTAEETRRLFAEGNAVFTIDTATALATMRREGGKIAMIPTGPSGRPEPGLAAPSYCIPAASPAKEEAWALLRRLLSPEQMVEEAVESGLVEPARQSVLDSGAFAAACDADFREVVRRSRMYARINRPLVANGIELGDIVGAAAEAAIAGEQPADEALRIAQAMIDAMDWSFGYHLPS